MKSKQTQTRAIDNSMQATTAHIADGLIITVGEARKILGADAKELRDEELITLIYELGEMAQAVLKMPFHSVKDNYII